MRSLYPRTCANPLCPCQNPQPVSHFYERKNICITCYKDRERKRTRAKKPVKDEQNLRVNNGLDRAEAHTDSWIPLCEHCPQDDCIRPEGAYRIHGSYKNRTFEGCLVWAAEVGGLDRDGVETALKVIVSGSSLPPQTTPAAPRTVPRPRP